MIATAAQIPAVIRSADLLPGSHCDLQRHPLDRNSALHAA